MRNFEKMPNGASNEKVKLEKVHNACWLVHCEGNSQSPFEFQTEKEAREFTQILFFERIGEL